MKVRVTTNIRIGIDGTAVTLRSGVHDLDDKLAKVVIAGGYGVEVKDAPKAPEPKKPEPIKKEGGKK